MKVINKNLTESVSYGTEDLIQDKEYTVLAISFYKDKGVVFFHLIDESGLWVQKNSSDLNITDNTPSKHWIAEWDNENHFFIAPSDFFEPYYFDKLTDLDIETEKNFKSVCEKLLAENNHFPLNSVLLIKSGEFRGMFMYIEYSEKIKGFVVSISERFQSVKNNPEIAEFFNNESGLSSYINDRGIEFTFI